MVHTLLEKRADPNETDNLGRTALIHAAAQGHAPVVEALIQAGTDALYSPSTDGRTALHWAAFYGHRSHRAITHRFASLLHTFFFAVFRVMRHDRAPLGHLPLLLC